MSKWVKCIREGKHKGVIALDKKYEIILSGNGKYEIYTDVDENWIIEESYFTHCCPPEKIKIEKMEFSDLSCHEIDTPTPLKPSDPVPEYCYHVTNKAIKHDKCSFVKSRQSDGTTEEYILLDHGGKRNFGDTYASLEDVVIIAKQLWESKQ